MRDEMRERLGKLDPMHPGMPITSVTAKTSRELLEKVMNTQTEERPRSKGTQRRSSWAVRIATAGALVVAASAFVVYGGFNPSSQPLVLAAGEEDTMASCIAFTPEELARVAEIAFEGTVTEVDGPRITMTVDHWFRGAEADQVVLEAPLGMEALIGGIPFAEGGQYLISAEDGTVNYCGFSGPSTPEYRAAFEAAFTG